MGFFKGCLYVLRFVVSFWCLVGLAAIAIILLIKGQTMKHEYKLLESAGSCELGIAATRYLAEGWELWGNPFSTTSMFGDRYFHQAVVRQVESEHGGVRMAEKPAGYTVHVPETSEFQTSPMVVNDWLMFHEPICTCENGNGDNPDCPVHFGNNLVS